MSEGLAIASIVLSAIAILAAFTAIAFVVGLKNSTHNIQYVPLDAPLKETEVGPAFTEESDDFLADDDDLDGGDWSGRPSPKRLRNKA